ncbi:MAG: 1-acyl-sn-glycerol-3-phosphate acyltransferase [Pseudomonadota bacterium]
MLRGHLFVGLSFAVWLGFAVLGLFLILLPRRFSIMALKLWARVEVWLLRVVCATQLEIRGLEKLPDGGFVVAAKHQSPFETFALLPLFQDPAMVLKKELTDVPLFGWWCRKFQMIPVDRAAGMRGMKEMATHVGREAEAGRQIIIFPEGTRTQPGAEPDYKPGVAFVYGQLDVPCVPVALNSGLFWPARGPDRHPGTIIIEILEPIPPGLDRRAFMAKLQESIERASDALIDEAAATSSPPPTIAAAMERRTSRGPVSREKTVSGFEIVA